MSEQLRLRAVELAVNSGAKPEQVVQTATDILAFLNDSIAPAQPAASSSSESSTTPAAPTRKKRSSAASASTEPASAETAAASSTSTEAKPAEASQPATTGTSQASSTPSLDDVRGALTRYQAACNGDMGPPREILAKYATSGTLGTLKEENRAKVISECDAAAKAKAA